MIKKFNESNSTDNTAHMSKIFKKQVVYSVDCSDLASLIQKLYGRDPEIEASLELGDDDTYEIDADSSEFDESDFEKWIVRQQFERSEIYMIMNKLAFDGHIVNGTYLIKTC